MFYGKCRVELNDFQERQNKSPIKALRRRGTVGNGVENSTFISIFPSN